ncbi:sodium:proton antiporter [Virgibacillus pantothenticus]|uniref:Sodium:proton antiporter n=1 Tax=Virgibacillus pantothenticus TaxID=1473 RepID=A0A0L0QRP4_VIRPA|nr:MULTISPECIES: Na+/H+ antiporter NhaC family protein [Virgibacillus]API92113.1 sodium:proton antiporter [Virgibacillus sp. 6R]KNE21274.1 sodium:proton antiporter [Virgibacillus pantothenticus]MBS7430582.1 sodium:proton antiporter [Virgibacillus sp. 19R1-5]MBU8568350.1 sodium:proton antiporter [Virgibacillus pantothenticus]MBU8602377.1 sodium:proton antiporter [Virgibacillus pantothenticus]
MLLNPVVLSVLALVVLSLARVHVIFALLIASIVGGISAGISLEETFTLLIGGLGGQGETALSYILLGILSVMIARSGITTLFIQRVLPYMQGRRAIVLFLLAGVASLSQNVVPIHIAFIPILIPPLLAIFNKMKVDRRGIATALTFGLKAPYILIPIGFGLIFQNIIVDEMKANGMEIGLSQVPLAMVIPVAGMVIGLAIAILYTYRKPREYHEIPTQFTNDAAATNDKTNASWQWQHSVTLLSLAVTLTLQLVYGSLALAALGGILTMLVLRAETWQSGDVIVEDGVKMMGVIAFVMLIASGYAAVLKETGSVQALVQSASAWLGDSQFLAAVVMMIIGMLVTIGIGTSFGTIPVLAAIFVPICASLGFSPLATAALIGTSGAIGDAGSPASDSTLGPTSGLNVDGQHHHIWDTCVPTFIHYNIPLFICGIIAALVL